ncbi:hypothetical protein [Longimicrobium sp.]|uniref:hypothetical protein n=1 Tax=Longimicrobium sp. TaxID=2029185 RepID=UPI002E2EC84D|nr:hypothetical protein [Longimicrobium sp.]HEX6041312.1 hypothetical protein [Longimicrobium sp.]
MSLRNRALPVLAALLLATPAAAQIDPRITDAESLVRAMHHRWNESWYRTLTFTQATTRVLPNDSSTTEVWREWGSMPGRLRIEMGPAELGRTVIYNRDSTFVLNQGRVVRRDERWNELMTLGFDVYTQAPERTMEQLRRAGFDLSRFHVDSLDGVPVYVVGADRGDAASRQFAIEADRLLFMRFISPIPNQAGKTQHVWFRAYQPAGRAWIAPEVEVLVDGRRVFHEVYSDIRVGEPIDERLFDPDAAP